MTEVGMESLIQTEYLRFKKVKYLGKHTERQESRQPVKVKVLILKKLESTITSFSMKRCQTSVRTCQRRKQHLQKDISVSPKKDVTSRTSCQTKQRNVSSGRGTVSWDPDSFFSDSGSSVVSDEPDKPLKSSVSVVVDLKIPHSESENRRQSSLSSVECGKIVLGQGSMAEDILHTLRLNKTASRLQLMLDDPFCSPTESRECLDSHLDDNTSITSGPSSPTSALFLLRCKECRRLFTKMKRQGPAKTKKRDHDPASLACDVWMLKKAWHPWRQQQVKGRLWVHLKRIRKLAVEQSATGVTNTGCSRPHVFLQRNLRHCRAGLSMSGGLRKSRAEPHHRRRPKANTTWPPIGRRCQKKKKRKPSGKDSTSKHFSFLDCTTATNTTEGNLPDGAHHTGLQLEEKVPKKPSISDTSSFLDKPSSCDHLEGACRVLKFEDTPSMLPKKMQKPKQDFAHTCAGRRQYEGQANFKVKDCDHSEVENALSEEFRTPSEVPSVESKIVRKSKPSFLSSAISPHGSSQRGSFRSMLAAFRKSHNQIIKESHT